MEAFRSDAIAVVPSLSTEGTSLACLEAWSAGAVVVSTGVGGLSNLVLDGVTGFIARPDGAAFADVLRRVSDLPMEALERVRRTAFEASQGSFGVDRWRESWRGIFELRGRVGH